MSADYIGLGLTIHQPTISKTPDEARAALTPHLKTLEDGVEEFDYQGYLDATGETVEDTFLEALHWLGDLSEANMWPVPGAPEGTYFITAGGMSWGDSPFEAFDAVCMLSDAAVAFPQVGRALGVLGGGIRLDYES